jgi:hypothetical protein
LWNPSTLPDLAGTYHIQALDASGTCHDAEDIDNGTDTEPESPERKFDIIILNRIILFHD